jgi:hypothetical protein
MKTFIRSILIAILTSLFVILIFFIVSSLLKTEKPGFVSACAFSFLITFFLTFRFPYTRWYFGVVIYIPLFILLYLSYDGENTFFYLKSMFICSLLSYLGAYLGFQNYSRNKLGLSGNLKLFNILITVSVVLFLGIYLGYRNAKLDRPLIAELNSILKDDQEIRFQLGRAYRESGDTASIIKKMKATDSINLKSITRILDKYGWIGEDKIGWTGVSAIWAAIQHSPLETEEKYLPEMRKAVKKGNARSGQLALLEDRVLMFEGKEQIYGSQVRTDSLGITKFWPIKDEKNVNLRRFFAGLGPIQKYSGSLGFEYKLP